MMPCPVGDHDAEGHAGKQIGEAKKRRDAGGHKDKPGGLEQHRLPGPQPASEPGHGQTQDNAQKNRPPDIQKTDSKGRKPGTAIAQQQLCADQADTEQDGAPGIVNGDDLKHQPGQRAVGTRFLQRIQCCCRRCCCCDGTQEQRSGKIPGNQPDCDGNKGCRYQGDRNAHDHRLPAFRQILHSHALAQQEADHGKR